MKKNILKFSSLFVALLLGTALVGCNGGSSEDVVKISFYAVNDLHGKFMDTDSQPGVDEFTTYVKELYQDTESEEVLLSSGDMWQGTVESSLTRGSLMTEWMNDVGFVSMTLGNHEFDWGAAVLKPNSELARFPFLGINVTYNGGPADFCQPSTTVERGGVKIGVIGAIGDCLGSISGEFKTGLYFKTGNELTNLVKNEATRLREEENCDLIVYSVHDGGEGYSSGVNNVENSDMGWYDTSLSDGYVDLVFEAHTHQQYILKDEYGVYHLQGGGENRAVSCAQVEFNTATGKYTVTPRLISNNVYAKSSIADAPVVKSLYRRYFADSDPYENVLGNNVSEWDSTDICDKLAELYLKKGVDTWGDQYDIVLGGGYLNTRSPYDLARGSVTYADVFSLLPFDNAIVLGGISGRYLKSNFLTPKRNYYSYTNGNIVAADIDDNETYYIIVDSYTSTYAPNHITEVARLGGETYARDLLAEYIAAGKRA